MLVLCFFSFLVQPIAEVVEGSLEDYEEGLKACEEASKIWMQVVYLFFIFFLTRFICTTIYAVEFRNNIC